MPKRYKSKAMAVIHETMQGLHRVGSIDDARMRQFDDACLAPGSSEGQKPAASGRNAPQSRTMTFQMYKDSAGEWRWLLLGTNGKLIASSGAGYKSRKMCLATIALVKKAADAEVAA